MIEGTVRLEVVAGNDPLRRERLTDELITTLSDDAVIAASRLTVTKEAPLSVADRATVHALAEHGAEPVVLLALPPVRGDRASRGGLRSGSATNPAPGAASRLGRDERQPVVELSDPGARLRLR